MPSEQSNPAISPYSGIPTRPAPAKSCFHIPRKKQMYEEDGVYRATCRRCECDLVRTLASRKWYRSGLFG